MSKKILIITIVLLAVTASLFASSDAFDKVNYTLSLNGITDESVKVVHNYSNLLSTTEKMLILNQYKKSGVVPFLLNFFIGLGLGSWIQGDYVNAGIQLGLDIIGVSLILIERFALYSSMSGKPFYSGAAGGLGIMILSCNRLYQGITPWVKAGQVNRKLEDALLNKNEAKFTITPIIGEKIGLMANINL